MDYSKEFQAQSFGQIVLKHKKLPIYMTKEFSFYRCVEFKPDFYGKTVSELFNGNLRFSSGRYSTLFPNRKISYWSSSPSLARAEIKSHGAGCDMLTFHAYDDATSFEPFLGIEEPLIIVDGRECGIQELIDKLDNDEELSLYEKEYFEQIINESIDCIAYNSKVRKGEENYIFLEKGFKKLALRSLKLRFGRKNGGSHAYIQCAYGSDYLPYLKGYGFYFEPKCKIMMNEEYMKSEEFLTRKSNLDRRMIRNSFNKN